MCATVLRAFCALCSVSKLSTIVVTGHLVMPDTYKPEAMVPQHVTPDSSVVLRGTV